MKSDLRILFWTPRIICILAILFLSLFALDSFGGDKTFWQQVGGFFIHMIPMIILTILLILAWKQELAGGILFVVLGISLIVIYGIAGSRPGGATLFRTLIWGLMLFSPFVLAGILFIISSLKKKKEAAGEK